MVALSNEGLLLVLADFIDVERVDDWSTERHTFSPGTHTFTYKKG